MALKILMLLAIKTLEMSQGCVAMHFAMKYRSFVNLEMYNSSETGD